jgi:hypothetical protein
MRAIGVDDAEACVGKWRQQAANAFAPRITWRFLAGVAAKRRQHCGDREQEAIVLHRGRVWVSAGIDIYVSGKMSCLQIVRFESE